MKIRNNLSLSVDLYELTMAASYLEHKKNTTATFDLFIRSLPQNRSYLLAAGLEDCLDYLANLKFDAGQINYLKSLDIFKEDFLRFLAELKFSGDVWALPEGTIFFPNEPILRVTAPIIEAQIIESSLLNSINVATMLASKAARVVFSAKGRGVYDFSLRRTHGIDAGLKAARSSFIAGCRGTSNCLAGLAYGIPVVGTMAHSFVMSFQNELESFRAFSRTFPERSILLVDTYNNLKGIANAASVAKELENQGHKLRGIRLDSGDLLSVSKKARKILDRAGLNYVKIFASGDLDEYKIEALLKRKCAIDDFGVGTNMGTSNDAPSLDVIYKISEVTDNQGRFLPTMKLSQGKVTYPGRKQVFRVFGKDGLMKKDVLGLESETRIEGEPLLVKVIEKGKIIYALPTLNQIQEFTHKNLDTLPMEYKKLRGTKIFPVEISPRLLSLTKELEKSLKTRSYQ